MAQYTDFRLTKKLLHSSEVITVSRVISLSSRPSLDYTFWGLVRHPKGVSIDRIEAIGFNALTSHEEIILATHEVTYTISELREMYAEWKWSNANVKSEAQAGAAWSDIAKSAYETFCSCITQENYSWESLPRHDQIAWEAAVRQAGECIASGTIPDHKRWKDWKPPK